MRDKPAIVLSCEHGGNRIPAAWQGAFANAGKTLATHAGYDIGAIDAARVIQDILEAPLIEAQVSRLLIDLNRSLHHAKVFSVYTKGLPARQKETIIDRHYRPYREKLTNCIATSQGAGRPVVHISVHSFTGRLNTTVRNADLGLLYDPGRKPERRLCTDLSAALKSQLPELRVRLNYPYRGAADGMTTALRKQFPSTRYLGIELEFNQNLFKNKRLWKASVEAVALSLRRLIQGN